MSKGLGKLQRDILNFLESNKLAEEYPICVKLIAWMGTRTIKPDMTYVQGCVQDPTPEELAAYHARMQSIRRALRGLHERDLVVKFVPSEGDQREFTWMATSAYEASCLKEILEDSTND